MSDYYVAPPGLVLRAALPAALGTSKRPEPPVKARRMLVLARQLPSLIEREKAFARSPQQRALYELLESLGGRASVEQAVATLDCSPAVVAGLVKRGLAAIEKEAVARDPFALRSAPAAQPHDPIRGATRGDRRAHRGARRVRLRCCTESPEAARRSSTSSCSSTSCRCSAGRRSCSCPRSRSRRKPSIAFAPCSATRWRCCTRAQRRRALRCVARAAERRAAHRGRRAVCDLRAAPRSRRHHRR